MQKNLVHEKARNVHSIRRKRMTKVADIFEANTIESLSFVKTNVDSNFKRYEQKAFAKPAILD